MRIARLVTMAALSAALAATLVAGPGGAAAPRRTALVVGHHLDPTTLSAEQTTTAAFQSVFAHITEQLVIFAPDKAEVRPWLATGWKWVNPTTLEMKVRAGVKFTNGEEFDAEAARYSIEVLMRAGPYGMWTRGALNRIDVVDKTTLRVHLNRQAAYFLPLLARGGFVYPPRYHRENPQRYGSRPIGTGPFVLREWARGSHIVLERFPGYWGGPHPIERVTFRIIPEDTARMAALEAGEIDIALNAPITYYNRLKINRDLALHTMPGLRKFTAFFNTRLEGPLRDRRVRVAMNHAVDQKAIANRVFGGQAKPLEGQWFLPAEYGYSAAVKAYGYNPERARKLLAEAGVPNGFETALRYTVGRYPLDKELGEIVSSYLEAVGIKVRQFPLEYGEFLRQRTAGQMGPIHQWGLLVPPDAHFSFTLYIKGSIYRFHDYPEEWDRLIDQAAQELDPRKRLALYERLNKMAYDDPFGIYLIVPNDLYAVNRRVQNFTPRFDEVLWLFDVKFQ
ncbi:MAG: hypothetical protein HY660_05985 [Armatimonadetes bacterium]|nr:hypothetical protein [Armatimonadota bacterium]